MWKRVLGYGVVIWLVPFVLSIALFGVRQADRPLFESLMVVIGVATATAAGLLFLRRGRRVDWAAALGVGLIWAMVSVLLDLPFFLGPFGMTLAEYAGDVAVSYLAIPLILMGLALAGEPGPA